MGTDRTSAGDLNNGAGGVRKGGELVRIGDHALNVRGGDTDIPEGKKRRLPCSWRLGGNVSR